MLQRGMAIGVRRFLFCMRVIGNTGERLNPCEQKLLPGKWIAYTYSCASGSEKLILLNAASMSKISVYICKIQNFMISRKF